MFCKNNQLYHFNPDNQEFRGIVIAGKAVSVYNTQQYIQQYSQHQGERQQFCTLVQKQISRLLDQGKLFHLKNQTSFALNDILLNHSLQDLSVYQVYLGNQVYSPFVSLQRTIIMLFPSKPRKFLCSAFIKSSQYFSKYQNGIPLLDKIMKKEFILKNKKLKGVYFIQQGEIQVRSRRIVSNGWVTCGKCKKSGYGWKFQVVPFMRFITKDFGIWKQFFSDILLNHEYPFNINHILGLTKQQQEYITPSIDSKKWRSHDKLKTRSMKKNRKQQFPKIKKEARSVDETKLMQIEKIRHYNQKINNIFSYKQDILWRKLKRNIYDEFQPIFKEESKQKKITKLLILHKLNQRNSQYLKECSNREHSKQNSKTQNILIMSVLNKLESMVQDKSNRYDQHQKNNQQLDQKQSYNNVKKQHQKRQNAKLLPMQIIERDRALRKNKKL